MKAIDSSSHKSELIQALLDADPDLSLRDEMKGQTALERARDYWGWPEVTQQIVDHIERKKSEAENILLESSIDDKTACAQTGIKF